MLTTGCCSMGGEYAKAGRLDVGSVSLPTFVRRKGNMIRLGSLPRVSPAFVVMVGVVLGCFVYNVAKEKTQEELPKERVKIVGTVVDSPRETDKRVLFTMYVEEGQMKGKKIRCYMSKKDRVSVQLGCRYEMWAKLMAFKNFTTEGHFDYPRWAESRSLAAQTMVRRGRLREVGGESHLPLLMWVELKAKELQRKILSLYASENIDGEHYALVAAMAFGDKNELSKETREMFTRAGVAHLLALSGLHLGILYAMLSLLFVRYSHRVVGSVVVIATLWMYVFVVGLPASVVRAATMLTLYTLLSMDGRRNGSAGPLYVAVAVILLVSPRMLWDVSFQMSVLAVWAIARVYGPLYRLMPRRWIVWWPVRAVWAMAVVSLSAQMGVAPLVVYYFGNFSFVFLLTNVVAVPLVTIFLYVVFVSLAVWWWPWMRGVLLSVQGTVCDWLEKMLGWVDSMSGASVSGLNVSEWALVGMYVATIVVMMGVKWASEKLERKRANNLSV